MTKVKKSTARDVDEDITHMRERLGLVSDAELANALDIDPSAVSAWRRRGKVPYKHLKQVERWTANSAAISHPEFLVRRRAYGYGLLASASIVLHSQFKNVEELNHFIWYGFRLARLHIHFERRLNAVQFGDMEALAGEFAAIQTSLERADLVEWIDSLPAD